MSNAQVNNKFLDLSGFGISGKGAFIDLLREFDNYDTPRPDFEFGLIRIKDGLLDLKCSLVDNWSPVRSDVSIKKPAKGLLPKDLDRVIGKKLVKNCLKGRSIQIDDLSL